jgi:putative iron-regulated protein
MTSIRWLSGFLLMTACWTSGCGDDSSTAGTGGGAPVGEDPKPTIANYAKLVLANYEDALTGAQAIQEAVDAFVDAPSESSLERAKKAWKDARPTYIQTEVFRFYGGPIDDEKTGPEGRINGWPLDEFYIDYVEGEPEAGIINRPEEFPEIDADLIAELNEKDGEKNLSAGFHAIEFLLWGQDQSETGPGERPFTDYVSGPTGTAENQDRRGAYLKAAAELLVRDLELVRDAWEPNQGYAASFTQEDPDSALQKILVGMGNLSGGELKRERINNAYVTKDQEEEHSCFSDTTHVDHYNDAVGIQNVYLGRYGSVQGPGLDVLVAALDVDLDKRMKEQLQAAIDAIGAIPEPFDQAIFDESEGGGRAKIKAAMDRLQELTDTTLEVATTLGVSVNIE